MRATPKSRRGTRDLGEGGAFPRLLCSDSALDSWPGDAAVRVPGVTGLHGAVVTGAAWGGGCWAVFPVGPEPQPPPSTGGTSLEGP